MNYYCLSESDIHSLSTRAGTFGHFLEDIVRQIELHDLEWCTLGPVVRSGLRWFEQGETRLRDSEGRHGGECRWLLVNKDGGGLQILIQVVVEQQAC